MGTSSAADNPGYPFPHHTQMAAGTIRPIRFSEAEQDASVARYYDQWKATYLVEETVGDDRMERVAFGKSAKDRRRTVSEGQGYGMVIVALMAGHDPAAQAIFDGLWKFVKANPSAIDHRLMAWEVPSDKSEEKDSACDGDMDIAYGLLLADRQWGSGGAISYREAAKQRIAAIKGSTIGPQSHLPLLGDWVKGSDFTEWQTRPSDFMTGHFRAFDRFGGDPEWGKVVVATQKVIDQIQAQFSPKTGLLPDFVVAQSMNPFVAKPAPPKFLEEKTDGAFSYNSCRTPWRIATDFVLNGDPTSRVEAQKMSRWIERATGGDPHQIRGGYGLDGRPARHADDFSLVFAAPFGVGAMTDPAQQKWLDDIFAAVRETHDDYYEDTVTLLSLLVMTGNFWDPTLVK